MDITFRNKYRRVQRFERDETNRFEDTRSPFPDKHMVFWAQGVGVVKHKHDMITDDLNPDRRLFPS
jgi:hypothetical protein